MCLTAHARTTEFGVLAGFDWMMLIGKCTSSVSKNNLCAENDADSPTVCAGLNRPESKVVFNLSAVNSLSL